MIDTFISFYTIIRFLSVQYHLLEIKINTILAFTLKYLLPITHYYFSLPKHLHCGGQMNIDQLTEYLRTDNEFMDNVRLWMKLDPQSATYADFPDDIDSRLIDVLSNRNIKQLYSHQRSAYDAISHGENAVIVTPTASGKTLCYNLPVLDSILKDSSTRALYLFPTKALAQDQMNELHEIITELSADIKTFTYDGDTPTSARQAVRSAGQIVVTNPDMLHAGILPHHTVWIKLFENLKYIVIDEIHSYRGVFGSHLTNVLRRLKRISSYYGADPQFIFCSATIRNPREHAMALGELPFTLIDNNGAPHGERNYIVYNPPVVNRELGIRASAVKEASRIASNFLLNKIPTIVFARSRVRVEVITTYLHQSCPRIEIAAYRGGYLPNERRRIEKGLRNGSISGVVSTNALELGIDIGMLDTAITVGYPGSISSIHQQFGRAGRRGSSSLAIIIATSSPLDQYIANNPGYIINGNPECATINPDNLLILIDHIKCAAFELPFKTDERFAPHLGTTTEMLDYLSEMGVLKKSGDQYHWMSDIYPANEISLRTASQENFVIIDTTEKNTVIGDIDFHSAPTLIHQDAIYLHQGRQYYIDQLDWERRSAFCHEIDSDYYTDAEEKADLQVLEVHDKRTSGDVTLCRGEINLRTKAIMFKKIKFNTHENLGYGKINLPEIEMHTAATWIEFEQEFLDALAGKSNSGEILYGIAYIIRNIAPIFTIADYSDLRVIQEAKSNFSGKPTIIIYDTIPGGIGISSRIFDNLKLIVTESIKTIRNCGCEHGCPGCIGPHPAPMSRAKELVIESMEILLNNGL